MCVCLELNGVKVSPGDKVAVWFDDDRTEKFVWRGFARSEMMGWWRRHGAEEVDIPADRFAVRSMVSGNLVWTNLEVGAVVRGVIDRSTPEPTLRVVTRDATAGEMLHCQHERMPETGRPIFSSEMPPTVGLPLFDVDLEHAAGPRVVQEQLL